MRNFICKFCHMMLVSILILGAADDLIAAPAPALTRIAPVALWAEETAGIPAPESYPNRVPEGIVFRGENLYVMIPLDQPGTEAFDLCIPAADASSGAQQCACIRGIRTEKRG